MNISSKILKYSYLFIIIVITLTFIYKTFIYDSKYEPYILKKLSHPEKNIYVNLSNDNIYTDEFKNVFNDISNKVTLPKDLYISDSFKIFFNNQGTITSINGLLYGKNERGGTDSFYINYNYNKTKTISLTMNKDVKANYNKKYRLSPFINNLSSLPLKYATSNYDSHTYGISYSGERTFSANTKGIVYIDSKGTTKEPTNLCTSSVTGYTISLFIPNQEMIAPSLKYIITDNIDTTDGEITTSLDRCDLSNIEKQISKPLNDNEVEFRLNDTIIYKLLTNDQSSNTYTLCKYNSTINENTIINNDIPKIADINNINLTFFNENLGFLSVKSDKKIQLLRTENGGKNFETISFDNMLSNLLEKESMNIAPIKLSAPYKESYLLYLRLQSDQSYYSDKSYLLCQSEDNGKTWCIIKNVNFDLQTEKKLIGG